MQFSANSEASSVTHVIPQVTDVISYGNDNDDGDDEMTHKDQQFKVTC